MPGSRTRPPCSREEGFALIEVVVSALIAAVVVGGVITLLSSTGKASAEERRHSQAYSIAQENQAVLRSTRLSELDNAMEPETVVVGGTTYQITPSAKFISDKTSATTCTGGNASADYVQIGSTVTWSGMRTGATPVILESIVSPVSGSLDPTAGGLAIHVVNGSATPVPISGVGLTGSGPGTFSGSTDSTGCAVFGGVPAGSYTVTPSLGSEYVDVNGEAPAAKKISIVGGTTTPLEFVFDRKSKVELTFKVKEAGGSNLVAANGDAVVATATGMTSGAKAFGTPGTFVSKVAAEPLFPFSYPYTFYAGSCSTNSPEAGAASVIAPVGGSASGVIQLPPLYLLVKNSTGTTAEKTAISGATVTVTDKKCSIGTTPVKRTYTTNSTGALSNPGLPWSTYEICASFKPSGSSTTRRLYAKIKEGTKETKEIPVHSLSGTSVTIDLGPTGFESGTC